MEERQLTEKQSFELISQMINKTREGFEKSSGVPFLIWGYTTVIVALAVWYLISTTQNYQWGWFWFTIPVVGSIGLGFFFSGQKKEHRPKTYIDRVIRYIWLVLGVAAFIISCVAIIKQMPILFMMIMMMGIGTALTGLVIRFRPLAFFGYIGMAMSFLCLFISGIDQTLLFAAAFLVMMVIPGHILNNAARKKKIGKGE